MTARIRATARASIAAILVLAGGAAVRAAGPDAHGQAAHGTSAPGTSAHGTSADGLVELRDASAAAYQAGPPNLPKGTQIGMISGDPAKPGPFVLRVKVPARTVIAPHTHAQAETLTILSGAIWHQHGTTVDKAAGKELRAGGFVFLPADMPHALWTGDEPVELQVNGSGPFGLNYINPADDPSRRAER